MVRNNITIPTPDETLNNFFKWFDVRKRIAFITAFVIGILTHITMMTEMIMSQDGLWNSIQYFRPGNWELSLGRWGITIIERFNGFLALPTISTISCILLMSVTAVILIDLFELKSKISIIFTSAILVLTPTFTITLLYIYTSLAYCFCMMLSCLVIWLIYKVKNRKLGIALGSLCFVFTLSIYQSYAGLTVGLCIMNSILYLLRTEKKSKEVIKEILETAGAVIVGGILYFIITKILLSVLGLELTNYKGNNSSFIEIIINLKNSILYSYKDFLAFFFRDRIIYNTNYRREVLYLVFFTSSGILGIFNLLNLKENDKKEKNIKICLVMALLIVLPIGLNIINILIAESEIYSLTASQMILMIPFCFALMENVDKLNLIKWLSIISCLAIMGTYYLANNASYAALKLTYNQAYSTTERLIDRIENTPGYEKTYSILFGGIIGNNNFPRTSNLYNYTIGSIVNNTAFHGTYGGQIGTWVNFIKIFFGLDIIPCEENVYYTIVNSQEYKEMEVFPAQNSIKLKDGIVIVKLSEEPPLPF